MCIKALRDKTSTEMRTCAERRTQCTESRTQSLAMLMISNIAIALLRIADLDLVLNTFRMPMVMLKHYMALSPPTSPPSAGFFRSFMHEQCNYNSNIYIYSFVGSVRYTCLPMSDTARWRAANWSNIFFILKDIPRSSSIALLVFLCGSSYPTGYTRLSLLVHSHC